MNPIAVIRSIVMGGHAHHVVTSHAQRKVRGEFRAGESHDPQAFGLLAGYVVGDKAEVTEVFPLARNALHDLRFQAEIHAVFTIPAVRDETSLHRRGWIANAEELFSVHAQCEERGLWLLGAYHTHRVPWGNDPLRETCTALDRQLARGHGLWTVIVSMVQPDRPIIRAFFEGDNEHEARLLSARNRSPHDARLRYGLAGKELADGPPLDVCGRMTRHVIPQQHGY